MVLHIARMDKLLWIASFAFVLFNSQSTALQPPPRMLAGCVSLDFWIYCYGGSHVTFSATNTFDSSGDFYALDVAESFTVSSSNSAWVEVQVNGTVRPENNTMFGMVALPQQDAIVLTGGAGSVYSNQSISNPTIAYNIESNEWQTLSSNAGLQSYAAGTAADASGRIYVFGGISDEATGELEMTDTRNMRIFNYESNQWSIVGLPDQFHSYAWHEGVMGNDGRTIYYMGGEIQGYFTLNNGSQVYGASDNTFDEIMTYNTETSSWATLNATGERIPTTRMWHTAALKPNSDDIVLYGGRTTGDLNVTADFCYVLNTVSMAWRQIDLSSSAGAGPRFGHSVAFPGNSTMMFVMFGVDANLHQRTDFQILDTDSWQWIDNYTGPGRSNSTEDQSDTSGDNGADGGASAGTIAGAVVGALAGVAIITGALFFFIRRRRRQQRQGANATRQVDEKNMGGSAKPPASYNYSNPNSSYTIQQQQQASVSPPQHYSQYAPAVPVTATMSSTSSGTFPPTTNQGATTTTSSQGQIASSNNPQDAYYTPHLRLQPVKPDGAE
ncbi:hypothetical protein BDB00DRAFT_832904 [Zychaea mexicana]|uniref:uncharacterized protein n=1 Tax=Zychaea mexicana TaxID=64656 RepID=UPI0022FEF19B|nr:uncharacterized protein BDB00DRAFT_832904 [Zychaea mexicana]KAI9491422.1 hypothetical protein BDB00DRAFT_832904 [Zychaea mexicana]